MLFTERVDQRMIPIGNYSTVSKDATLKDAVLSLRKSYCEMETGMCTEAGPRTILVIDENKRLVGILDFRSFLRTLIPELTGGLSAKLAALGVTMTFAQADAPALDESKSGFSARVIKNAETRVRDIMLKTKGTIDADASLMDALKVIYQNKITILPVYRDDTLVGVIRDTDLFLALSDVLAQGG